MFIHQPEVRHHDGDVEAIHRLQSASMRLKALSVLINRDGPHEHNVEHGDTACTVNYITRVRTNHTSATQQKQTR